MEFTRQREEQTSVTVPDTKSDAPVNQLGSARQLANASNQVIVQPNNDTLYTMGHLNLSDGPLVLHVSAIPDHRYFSFEFLDPYTNVFHYIGTRTTGDGAQTYVINGPWLPRQAAARLASGSPPRMSRPGSSGRTLVLGQIGDLPAVHKIQNGYKLLPLADYVKHGLSWKLATHRTHVVDDPQEARTSRPGWRSSIELGDRRSKDNAAAGARRGEDPRGAEDSRHRAGAGAVDRASQRSCDRRARRRPSPAVRARRS